MNIWRTRVRYETDRPGLRSMFNPPSVLSLQSSDIIRGRISMHFRYPSYPLRSTYFPALFSLPSFRAISSSQSILVRRPILIQTYYLFLPQRLPGVPSTTSKSAPRQSIITMQPRSATYDSVEHLVASFIDAEKVHGPTLDVLED